jgi:hypothetical protein
MQVSTILTGKRGKQVRLQFSQMGKDVGGGVLIELFNITPKGRGPLIASVREDTGKNSTPMKVLASWLLEDMPEAK